MNAQQIKSRRDVVALHIWERVKIRAKQKGNRVKKLEGKAARDGVINGATGRLMEIDAVFPIGIRRRLNPRRVGNITVRNIDPTLWLAWVLVHRYYIELGSFWYEDSDEHDALIDRALDAELKSHTRATAASGGIKQPDPTKMTTYENFERYLEDVNTFATEPSRLLEQQEQIEAEERATEDRKQEAAKEFEIMREKINTYSETLRLAHRRALFLICNEPTLTNSTIAAKVSLQSARGIAPATVSTIRDQFYSMAGKLLSLMEDPDDALNKLLREVETTTEGGCCDQGGAAPRCVAAHNDDRGA